MEIRDAVLSDIAQITEIYNSIVLTSTAIYNDRCSIAEERAGWWVRRVEQGFPVIVAVEGASVMGYGSFGEFRSWPGYRFTVEVHRPHTPKTCARTGHRQVAASRVDLPGTKAMGKHVIVAGMWTPRIKLSMRFLGRHGFVHIPVS